MNVIGELFEANSAYASAYVSVTDPRPAKRLAVLTCMDVRIDAFAVLGLHLGDAHVIRNAGGRVTDDVLRSLALSTQLMGAERLVVMQHTKCGLSGVTDQELRVRAGADLEFLTIADHEAALTEDVELLSKTPYLSPLSLIAGFLFDVESGGIEMLVHWERPVS